MQSVIPPGDPSRTMIASKAQGWRGLAVNYTTVQSDGGNEFPAMVTAWEPSPGDIAAIVAGAKILVSIIGIPPIAPMSVFVGEVPEQG
jgi:hypothetical protein